MAATTDLISKSVLVLDRDVQLNIDCGKMTSDKNGIVWTMASPNGAQALMLLLRGEPPK